MRSTLTLDELLEVIPFVLAEFLEGPASTKINVMTIRCRVIDLVPFKFLIHNACELINSQAARLCRLFERRES